jgi:hypothetical protein
VFDDITEMANSTDESVMSRDSKLLFVLTESHNRMRKFAEREREMAAFNQIVYDCENGQIGWEVPGVAVVLVKLHWDYPEAGNIQVLDVQAVGGGGGADQKDWVKNCEKLIRERGLLRIGDLIDSDVFATALEMSR